jgi:NarL family two-component system sensor histidine kinase LiaS
MLESHSATLARREERARIARELHDSLSQTLYAIILAAARARSLSEQNRGRDVQRVIDSVLDLANAGQSELRAVLTSIRSNQRASFELVSALALLAAEIRARGTFDVHLSIRKSRMCNCASRKRCR